MRNEVAKFGITGFAVVERVATEQCCGDLIQALPSIDCSGSRTLLSDSTFRGLVHEIRCHQALSHLLEGLVAVQCTLFRKSKNHNWAVRLHRDSVVPIHGDGPWESAGIKEGMDTRKPPREFLDNCVAVRVNLDGAPEEDVSVVPGSHRDSLLHNRMDSVPIPVPRGGALVMRPTLLHASSRLGKSEHRRVLHYLFANPSVPKEYGWYHAV